MKIYIVGLLFLSCFLAGAQPATKQEALHNICLFYAEGDTHIGRFSKKVYRSSE